MEKTGREPVWNNSKQPNGRTPKTLIPPPNTPPIDSLGEEVRGRNSSKEEAKRIELYLNQYALNIPEHLSKLYPYAITMIQKSAQTSSTMPQSIHPTAHNLYEIKDINILIEEGINKEMDPDRRGRILYVFDLEKYGEVIYTATKLEKDIYISIELKRGQNIPLNSPEEAVGEEDTRNKKAEAERREEENYLVISPIEQETKFSEKNKYPLIDTLHPRSSMQIYICRNLLQKWVTLLLEEIGFICPLPQHYIYKSEWEKGVLGVYIVDVRYLRKNSSNKNVEERGMNDNHNHNHNYSPVISLCINYKKLFTPEEYKNSLEYIRELEKEENISEKVYKLSIAGSYGKLIRDSSTNNIDYILKRIESLDMNKCAESHKHLMNEEEYEYIRDKKQPFLYTSDHQFILPELYNISYLIFPGELKYYLEGGKSKNNTKFPADSNNIVESNTVIDYVTQFLKELGDAISRAGGDVGGGGMRKIPALKLGVGRLNMGDKYSYSVIPENKADVDLHQPWGDLPQLGDPGEGAGGDNHIYRWGLAYAIRNTDQANNFLQGLTIAFRTFGITKDNIYGKLGEPVRYLIKGTFQEEFPAVKDTILESRNEDIIRLLVVILPSDTRSYKGLVRCINKECTLTLGIISHIVPSSLLEGEFLYRDIRDTWQILAAKMNRAMWTIPMPKELLLGETTTAATPTIALGIHIQVDLINTLYLGAEQLLFIGMVHTMKSQFTRITNHGSLFNLDDKFNLESQLKLFFSDIIQHFYFHFHTFPKCWIIYRTGDLFDHSEPTTIYDNILGKIYKEYKVHVPQFVYIKCEREWSVFAYSEVDIDREKIFRPGMSGICIEGDLDYIPESRENDSTFYLKTAPGREKGLVKYMILMNVTEEMTLEILRKFTYLMCWYSHDKNEPQELPSVLRYAYKLVKYMIHNCIYKMRIGRKHRFLRDKLFFL